MQVSLGPFWPRRRRVRPRFPNLKCRINLADADCDEMKLISLTSNSLLCSEPKRCLGSGRSVSSPLVPSFFPSLRPTPFDSLGLPPSLPSISLARFHPPSVRPSPPCRRRPRWAASPRAKISVVCAVSSDSIGHPESVVRRQRPATTPASSKSLRHSFPSWLNN